MSQQDSLQRILASLHEAVLDDSHWPATSGLIDEACGTKSNFLVSGEGTSQKDGAVFFARACLRGRHYQELEQLYFEVYFPLDERIGRMTQLPDSRLVHVSSLYTDEELKISRVYNEALPLYSARDSLNVRLDGPAGSHIVWVIGDPVEGHGWSSSRVETIERLLPHLRQYMRVRQALVDAGALGSSLATLLENKKTGVIQLDRRGRIVEANDHARHLLRSGDGLVDRSGLLHASSSTDDQKLQKLLAGALPPFGRQGASGSLVVRRSLLSPALVVHISPVGENQTDSRSQRVAALVLVMDPLNRATVDPALVAATLGLTPAESHVAVLLAQGKTIRDIAFEAGRSTGTIQWHIKQIFNKHGLSRQVELVQLVWMVADFPEVRR